VEDWIIVGHYSKDVTTDDFRGIAISSVISKVFEHCVLDRYHDFLKTRENQFGFLKVSGCSHAIATVRNVVNHYINSDSIQ